MGIQAIRIINPWFLELDNRGWPAAGYKVYTLEAGSVDTLVDTYLDKDLLTKNTNPIILNSRGECSIFTTLPSVKLVFASKTGDLTSPIWTQDYVTGADQQLLFNVGVAVGTTNNIYVVNTVPAYASIPDGFSLVMIPDVTNEDTFIERSFTGTGINDAFFYGPYIGDTPSTFQVQIDGNGSPNTFKWRKDAGTWTEGVEITGTKQTLQEGVSVKFSAIIGHTLGDLWTQTVQPPAYLNFCDLGNKIIYKSVNGALVALDGNDIIAGIPAHMDYSENQDCWILLNPTTQTESSGVTGTAAPNLTRKEITSTYGVDPDEDWGQELSCKGTFTVTLPSCTDFAGRFVYIVNAATGIITVQVAGAPDTILLPDYPGGVSSTDLDMVRTGAIFATNGVDWHILAQTEAEPFSHVEVIEASQTWVKPVASLKRVRVVLIGGGAGGQGTWNTFIIGRGGGGGALVMADVDVSGVASVDVVIGAGGAGGVGQPLTPYPPWSGGDTQFGDIVAKGAPNDGTGAIWSDDGRYGIYCNFYDFQGWGCLGFDGYDAPTVETNYPGQEGGGGDSGMHRGQGAAIQYNQYSPGLPGRGWGGGGGGGVFHIQNGGAGHDGVCIIWW